MLFGIIFSRSSLKVLCVFWVCVVGKLVPCPDGCNEIRMFFKNAVPSPQESSIGSVIVFKNASTDGPESRTVFLL